jgi:hypothetical protein
MAQLKWDITEIMPEIVKAGMDRIKECAEVFATHARQNCRVGTINRPAKGEFWTEREIGALKNTIRVVTKKDSQSRNVWIMAGNKKTWYATQVEYGRGGWKGGAHPFFRPAAAQSLAEMKNIIENGE